MNIDLIKESIIEYCENAYALGIKKINNLEIKNCLDELTLYEDRVRITNNENELNNYKLLISNVVKKIEEIINE